MRTDFETGLKKFKNNSVSVISSELALGYFNKQGIDFERDQTDVIRHTNNVIKLAHDKLKKGGKLMMVMDSETLDLTQMFFQKTGFDLANAKISKVKKASTAYGEYLGVERTSWMKDFANHGIIMYQLVVVK
jgi:hypothetical protein